MSLHTNIISKAVDQWHKSHRFLVKQGFIEDSQLPCLRLPAHFQKGSLRAVVPHCAMVLLRFRFKCKSFIWNFKNCGVSTIFKLCYRIPLMIGWNRPGVASYKHTKRCGGASWYHRSFGFPYLSTSWSNWSHFQLIRWNFTVVSGGNHQL